MTSPDDDVPVGTGIDLLAAADPDAVALICPDRTVTRAELAAASSCAARQFAALGVTEGSMVTIGLPNGAAFYVAVVVRHRVAWVYAVPTLMGRILRLPTEVRAGQAGLDRLARTEPPTASNHRQRPSTTA